MVGDDFRLTQHSDGDELGKARTHSVIGLAEIAPFVSQLRMRQRQNAAAA